MFYYRAEAICLLSTCKEKWKLTLESTEKDRRPKEQSAGDEDAAPKNNIQISDYRFVALALLPSM